MAAAWKLDLKGKRVEIGKWSSNLYKWANDGASTNSVTMLLWRKGTRGRLRRGPKVQTLVRKLGSLPQVTQSSQRKRKKKKTKKKKKAEKDPWSVSGSSRTDVSVTHLSGKHSWVQIWGVKRSSFDTDFDEHVKMFFPAVCWIFEGSYKGNKG